MTMTPAAPNFLAHGLPSKAVACPDCKARIGVNCIRPSGHKAMMIHGARHAEADRLWLIHDLPTITHRRDGSYVYDGPETRPSVTHPKEREQAMAKIGPKEQQRRDLREARVNRSPKTRPDSPAAKPQEKKAMTTKTKTKTKKTTKKAPAKKAPKTAPKKKSLIARIMSVGTVTPDGGAGGSSERTDGLRTGSKQAMMLDLAMEPGGKTEAELCAALGWKKCRVTLKRVCDKVGATLTQTKNGEGVTVWSATFPLAKAA